LFIEVFLLKKLLNQNILPPLFCYSKGDVIKVFLDITYEKKARKRRGDMVE